MNVTDFAELQKLYTGATNKRKWKICDKSKLEEYLAVHEYKIGLLSKTLGISYATTKRFLHSAGLLNKAVVKKQNYSSGRPRTSSSDKFGYIIAGPEHDIVSSTGEIYRRPLHHVVAEKKYNRKLKDREVVHHVDLNKKNNNLENIIICENNSTHRLLHGQLERVAGELVRLGVIKFDEIQGYYISEEMEGKQWTLD